MGTQVISNTLISKGVPTPQSLTSPAKLRQKQNSAIQVAATNQSVAKDLESIAHTVNTLHGVLSSVAPTISQIISLQNTSILLTTGAGTIFLDPSVPAITLTGAANGSKIVLDATVPALTLFDQAGTVAATLTDTQESPLGISATSNGAPDTLTVPGNTYLDGDTIHVVGATGDTAINGYRIVENTAGSTFQMTDLSGNPINGNGAYTGGGTSARYYSGLLAQTVALGSSFANFRLRLFADGRLVISGASLDGSSISGGGITSTGGSGGNVLTLNIANGLLTISGTGTAAGTGVITVDGFLDSPLYKAGGTPGVTATIGIPTVPPHSFTFKGGICTAAS